MKRYSESPKTARELGWPDQAAIGRTVDFFESGIQEWPDGSGPNDGGIVLLDERNTLYGYDLTELNSFRKEIGVRTLGIVCRKLHTPRGTGERRWVNTQWGRANFNANILLELETPVVGTKETFCLQQKISVGIANAIQAFTPGRTVEIHYPFHHLLDGGKVAGHLLQSKKTVVGTTILRIGVGINTGFAPELPKNDELVHHLYGPPTSVGIGLSEWVRLYRTLLGNVLSRLPLDSCQEEYGRLLTTPPGTSVRIYRDDGSIQIGNPLSEGKILEITDGGRLVLEDGKTYGTECHVEMV